MSKAAASPEVRREAIVAVSELSSRWWVRASAFVGLQQASCLAFDREIEFIENRLTSGLDSSATSARLLTRRAFLMKYRPSPTKLVDYFVGNDGDGG